MDAEIAKGIQKILQKQGIKFKVGTKVSSGDASGEGVKIAVEAAKGGKEESVGLQFSLDCVPLLTASSSLTLTSSSSPLAVVPTPLASASRTLALRLTRRAA